MSATMALILLILPDYVWSCEAKVVGIHDGDTITVLDDQKVQHKIRLAEIDAPELGQPYGKNARQVLSTFVFRKNVEIAPTDTDRYGRPIAVILVDGRSVNREIVSRGAAWAYRKYLHDQSLLDVEAEAKSAQRGMWALQTDQITAPWDWRHGSNPVRAAMSIKPDETQIAASSAGGFTCGSKRVCKEMTSCEEAYFYLTQCGLTRLDRDHDGIPCESICP